MDAIEQTRSLIRSMMGQIARALNYLTGGRLTPTHVTMAGVLAHFAVVWAIIDGRLVLAGILLAIFGLTDSLDGELARLQDRASNSGVILDASADRYKEGLVYAGLVYYLSANNQPWQAGLAVLAMSASFLISYIKAKAEAVISTNPKSRLDAQKLNRALGNDTYLRFEVRILLLVIALITGFIWPILALLAVGGVIAAWLRYIEADRVLRKS